MCVSIEDINSFVVLMAFHILRFRTLDRWELDGAVLRSDWPTQT